MNLGKSPARFDERPDTGISFDDIAGIDEAKAEFEEIVSFKRTREIHLLEQKYQRGIISWTSGTGKHY
jgi:cell division protease FtsH